MNTQPQHNQQKPRSLSPRFLSLSKESKGRLLLLFSLMFLASATMAQRSDVTEGNDDAQTEPGVTVNGSVFGGGNLAKVHGNTLVTVDQNTAVVVQDVYGGGALAEVGTNASNTTTVNILDGTIRHAVYGGGLGRKYAAATTDPDTGDPIPEVTAVEAKVNGVVTVNIGTSLGENGGSATLIGANVFGGNNTNGSPQDNVTVHIWKTAHTPEDSVSGTTFAIKDVFGGGNEADYIPAVEDKKCLVWVHGCENTIERTFGGGNAADAGTANDQGNITLKTNVQTIIEGGRIDKVFGGGNGERGPQFAADINGDLALAIHGGYVGQFYGASNANGTIRGSLSVDVDSEGDCGELTINELFSGSNAVDIAGNLVTNIDCSNSGALTINNLYGGCNQADIGGSVVLNVSGGNYINVYGGSCGTLTKPANIGGNVTLNLYGGTIENAYGGCNINGNVSGLITVNVIDVEGECPLYVTNVYGGSNLADYKPTYTVAEGEPRIAPVVNVVHAKNGISGNVYGGSKGREGVSEEEETKVNANPLVNVGYDATDMNTYLPSTYLDFITNTFNENYKPRAIIAGSVFGGGDAAKVVGNTKIMLRNRAKVFGNVYGGGNMGVVTGDTKVIVNGANN